MYTLVRRFIETGIAFLAAGVALGVYLLAPPPRALLLGTRLAGAAAATGIVPAAAAVRLARGG